MRALPMLPSEQQQMEEQKLVYLVNAEKNVPVVAMRQAMLECTVDDIRSCGRDLERALHDAVRCTSANPAQLAASAIGFQTVDVLGIGAADPDA